MTITSVRRASDLFFKSFKISLRNVLVTLGNCIYSGVFLLPAFYFNFKSCLETQKQINKNKSRVKISPEIITITHLSFFSLVSRFDNMVSTVSMLATHLTHTLPVVMAKQVQGSAVLVAGFGFHRGKLWVHAALSLHCIWLDLQIDRHGWWAGGRSSEGVLLQAVGPQLLHSLC